jgi:transcriptional regulator with XRE-family HTH domain
VLTEAEELKKLEYKLDQLCVKNGYGSCEDFAIKNELSRMQYWRIEKGKTNITLRSLIVILNIHNLTLEEFFHENLIKSKADWFTYLKSFSVSIFEPSIDFDKAKSPKEIIGSSNFNRSVACE